MPRATRLNAASPYPQGWEPFLAAINADLDDDTPRLVFADWLQENGDEPRAQFIRLQCAAARDGTRSDAADALLAEHQPRWLTGLPKMCREQPERVTFRRGFVAALTVRGRDWASTSAIDPNFDANGKTIRRLTALEELRFEQAWNTLMESGALKGLRALILSSAGSGLIESLARSPALPTLTRLLISAKSSDGISQRSFRALLATKALAGLRSLWIQSMPLGDVIAECLGAAHFANLEELRLRHLNMTAVGARALARSPVLATLRALSLCNNRFEDDGLAHLLPELRNLTELDLSLCDLTPKSARVLARWEGLRSVRRLDLTYNRMRRADAELIAASPYAVSLTDFEVPLDS